MQTVKIHGCHDRRSRFERDQDKSQLEEYIRSLDKLSSNKLDISVNLTAHPFSTGQTELIEKIKNRKLGEPHLLVSRSAFLQYVDGLKAGAEKC